MEQITILKNKEHNGFEIYANGKLTDQQKLSLELDGWRWHRYKKCYYACISKKRIALIHQLFGNDIKIIEDVDGTEDKIKALTRLYGTIQKLTNMPYSSDNAQLYNECAKALQKIQADIYKIKEENEKIPPMPF